MLANIPKTDTSIVGSASSSKDASISRAPTEGFYCGLPESEQCVVKTAKFRGTVRIDIRGVLLSVLSVAQSV